MKGILLSAAIGAAAGVAIVVLLTLVGLFADGLGGGA